MALNYRVPAPLNEIRNTIIGKEIEVISLLSDEAFLIAFVHFQSLLISFHPQFARCHTSERKTDKQNVFTKEMTERVRGLSVAALEVKGPAIILTLKGKEKEFALVAEFSLKRKNLLLLQEDEIVLAWRGSPTLPYRPPVQALAPFEEASSSQGLDRKFHLLEEKKFICNQVLNELKALQKIEANLKASEERCRGWKEKEREALLLKTNIYKVASGQKTLDVEDWETGKTVTVSLTGRDREESLKKAFQSAKRLKRGLEEIKEKRAAISLLIQKKQELLIAIQGTRSLKELSLFKNRLTKISRQERGKGKPKEKLPYREYLSQGGMLILVGKSRQENDLLTFKVASANDLWLHAHDFAGSHVVIRAKKNEEPDAKTLEEAAHLAIEFSQAKGERSADVLVTRQKNLRRIKGKPGQVMVREKKVIRIAFDKKTLDAVMKRKP